MALQLIPGFAGLEDQLQQFSTVYRLSRLFGLTYVHARMQEGRILPSIERLLGLDRAPFPTAHPAQDSALTLSCRAFCDAQGQPVLPQEARDDAILVRIAWTMFHSLSGQHSSGPWPRWKTSPSGLSIERH
jgi:hypothetical protein